MNRDAYDRVPDDDPHDDDVHDDNVAEDVRATLRFFMEADRLKEVERRNHLASGSRRENTAEHSWHLGIAAMIMAPFASEPVDLATAVCMALVHDIVEIDAGDTFAYDQSEAELAGKEAREQADRADAFLRPRQGWVAARATIPASLGTWHRVRCRRTAATPYPAW